MGSACEPSSHAKRIFQAAWRLCGKDFQIEDGPASACHQLHRPQMHRMWRTLLCITHFPTQMPSRQQVHTWLLAFVQSSVVACCMTVAIHLQPHLRNTAGLLAVPLACASTKLTTAGSCVVMSHSSELSMSRGVASSGKCGASSKCCTASLASSTSLHTSSITAKNSRRERRCVKWSTKYVSAHTPLLACHVLLHIRLV